ncbi:MAG: CobW family GTP-binding protein [Planctomycetota bacterium]
MSAPSAPSAPAASPVPNSARAAIPVQIVAGFLGAGKTSLLRRILAGRPAESRVAVVVNEFGAIPFDGVVLREPAPPPEASGRATARASAAPSRHDEPEAGPQIFDLPGGCICCTLAGELRRTLIDLAARPAEGAPPRGFDRILIEASGAATAGLLLQFFELDPDDLPAPLELAPVLAVVDASTLLARMQWDRQVFAGQLRMADMIVVNRLKALAQAERVQIEATLKELNPAAAILPDRPRANAWNWLCRDRFPGGAGATRRLHRQVRRLPDHFTALELPLPAAVGGEQLGAALEAAARDPACGRLLRAKALIAERTEPADSTPDAPASSGGRGRCVAVELAAGRAFVQRLSGGVDPALCGRLVLIGRDLHAARLSAHFAPPALAAEPEGR